MTAHTHDDSFHEIQLNGKQLVFVFMAATVVSVVIFLVGVLVGRGVRVERSAFAQAQAMSQSPSADIPAAGSTLPAAPIQASADPTAAAPPPALDDLSYPKRLEEGGPSVDELKPAAPRTAPEPAAAKPAVTEKPVTEKSVSVKPAAVEKPVPALSGKMAAPQTPTPTPAAPAVEPSPAPSAGSGYAVQVAALNVRGEADAIAKRLSAKGYAAYVQVPTSGTPSVFRVRVGTFKTRREAETVASRLQKEEQFKPWVTR